MRNSFKAASALVASMALVLLMATSLTGCPSVSGLHNQEAAQVTFVFKNMGVSGDYSIPGGYTSSTWVDNTDTDITLKDGAGTSTTVETVTLSTIKFSLVPVGYWTRPWYPTVKGNSWDGSSEWNFEVTGLTLGGEITITVDGSTTPATISVN